MNNASRHIAALLLKKLQEGLTEPEASELNVWLQASVRHRNFAEELEDGELLKELIEDRGGKTEQLVLDRLITKIAQQEGFTSERAVAPVRRIRFTRGRWWAAASVILALGIGAYLWTTHKKGTLSAEALAKVDISPGREGAVLTLADGRQVVLDSLGNGLIATQRGSQVLLKDGQLTYDATGEAPGDIVYNTMTTPKGRQFSLLLPDGTRVWLNAASSVTYPTVFAGKERKVTITGEAYFEVAKNAAKPFIVKTPGDQITVLGTHFNVNAYTDEAAVVTTLLEGRVEVQHDQQKNILQPGQAAENGKVKKADISQAVAWKNGLFNFNQLSLQEVLRQLSRWYDVEIVYRGPLTSKKFGGEIQRDLNLSEVLEVLKEAGIRFTIEGQKLIVQ